MPWAQAPARQPSSPTRSRSGGGFTGAVEIRMELSGAFLMNVPYGSFTGTTGPALSAYLSMWDDNPGAPESEAQLRVEQYTSEFLLSVDPLTTRGSWTNADSSGNFADPADVRAMLTASFVVTPATPTFSFRAQLATATGINASALLPGEHTTSERPPATARTSPWSFPQVCRGRPNRASSSSPCRNPVRARCWRQGCSASAPSDRSAVRSRAPETDRRGLYGGQSKARSAARARSEGR